MAEGLRRQTTGKRWDHLNFRNNYNYNGLNHKIDLNP